MENKNFKSYDEYLELQVSKISELDTNPYKAVKNEYHNGTRIGKQRWSKKLATLASIAPDTKALVLGARWGSDLRFLREAGFHDVIGIDLYNPPLVDEVRYGDAHFLSSYFSANQFDVFWAHHTFEHFFKPSKVIEEILKVGKKKIHMYVGLPFIEGKHKYDAQDEFENPFEFITFMSFYGMKMEMEDECYRGKKKHKLYKFYIFNRDASSLSSGFSGLE